MKTTDFIKEGYIADDADAMHKDHEVQMARQDCYNAAKNAIELHSLLKNISEMQGLEGWVSEKITLAADYLKTVKEHLEYNMLSHNEGVVTFSMESAEAKFAEVLDEAVLGGSKLGGPTSYKEFKDKEDYLLRQLSSPAQSSNYTELRQALGDLRRVAKERGFDTPQVSEDASVGGVSTGAVATSLGGGNGFANGGPGTISRQGKPKKVGNIPQKTKVTVGKGIY